MSLGRQRSHRGVMAEINVTPMVDVMLVLLIIFMVTAPLLQQGLDVNLPKASGKSLPPEEKLTITVKRDGSIHLNEKRMELRQLRAALKDLAPNAPTVFLRADKDVPYGRIVSVMAKVREAGIEKLGMVTEPEPSAE